MFVFVCLNVVVMCCDLFELYWFDLVLIVVDLRCLTCVCGVWCVLLI